MLDELRSLHPSLGFALYALEPDGLVTLEVIDEAGNVFTFKAPTVADALAIAFPPEPADPPEHAAATVFD